MAVVLARLRMPLIYLGLAAILVDSYLWDLPRWPLLGLLAVAFAIYLRLGTVRRSPVEVALPVAGRWLAFNSPADRVPSHHLHAYGQTYAIDLVHDPAGDRRPGLAWWPPARRPGDFPGFGQPVLAPADATVVRAHDAERDHWSRTSPPALLYLAVEGAVRELLGPGRILGNHLVLDLGGGVYAALAHLRRGSLRVRVGDGSPPASRWPTAATPATRPSPTCTSSSWTTPASCWPPASPSGSAITREGTPTRPASPPIWSASARPQPLRSRRGETAQCT
jgi:hypothetical protein